MGEGRRTVRHANAIHAETSAVLAVLMAVTAASMSLRPVWAADALPIEGSKHERLAAVAALSADKELPAEQKILVLVNAIRAEIDKPTGEPGEAQSANGWSEGEEVQEACIRTLPLVAGARLIWQALQRAAPATSEAEADRALRKRLLVAFAEAWLAEDRPPEFASQRRIAVGELVQVLRSDPYDFDRALAARALGMLGAKEEASDDLIAALEDGAFRDIEGHTDIQAPGWPIKLYRVRLEAALALKRLGYTVVRVSGEVWRVEKAPEEGNR